MNERTFFVEEYRNLSTKEINLIEWLLINTKHSELIEQIENAKVISKCNCGCPTVDLEVANVDNQSINFHLSASGYSPEGIPVGVILHVRNGVLSELEAYSEDGTKVFDLPEADKLKIL
jgi:hypothetical protein